MFNGEFRPPGGGKFQFIARAILLIFLNAIILFALLYPGEQSPDLPREQARSISAV